MPACSLYCEHCGTQQSHLLNEADFGLLLAAGEVSFPCDKCQEKKIWKLVPPPGRDPQLRRAPGPLRVLLIDDDPATLQILQLMLRPHRYSVITASSADNAIHKLQTLDFDVIVSDIRMPEFDGRSLYRFLVIYLPEYAKKVVFLTGDQSEKTLRFLRECNCPSTFKPIDLEKLEACIQQVS